ncbi:MAG: transposase [Myxococcales bacterium]|nr:transposase [Myxococcales bacterium]
MEQLELPRTRGWGGRRVGAGRKRLAPRPLVPHRPRPPHVGWAPVHLTLRCMSGLPSLRSMEVFPAVVSAIRSAQAAAFRVLHFSVQDNHVHLLVEANESAALRTGARSLGVRLARAINRACGRRGRVLDDRYHTRALRTPREVRFALAYVLFNFKKHQVRVPTRLDPCSSAPYCDGFRDRPAVSLTGAPVQAPHTWLARVGWRRHGLLSPDEAPA